MCNQIYLTAKEMDILSYVYSNGGFGVTTCPKAVKQNKNFYNRIRKLEEKGFIIVHRYDGRASDLDITSSGRDFLHETRNLPNTLEQENDLEFFISLVNSSSLSPSLKEKVVSVLS